jgi:hypothetical protein
MESTDQTPGNRDYMVDVNILAAAIALPGFGVNLLDRPLVHPSGRSLPNPEIAVVRIINPTLVAVKPLRGVPLAKRALVFPTMVPWFPVNWHLEPALNGGRLVPIVIVPDAIAEAVAGFTAFKGFANGLLHGAII